MNPVEEFLFFLRGEYERETLLVRRILEHALRAARNPPRDLLGNVREDWLTELEKYFRGK